MKINNICSVLSCAMHCIENQPNKDNELPQKQFQIFLSGFAGIGKNVFNHCNIRIPKKSSETSKLEP